MDARATAGNEPDLRLARRNVLLLTAVQAILGSAGPIVFAVGGVAGYQLLGDDKSLATVPLTGFTIGVAFGAIIIAFLSQRLGRPMSFALGAVLGALGGAIAAIALFKADFWLFAAGLCTLGISGGFTQKIRFAAADASPGRYKPTAISWILAGGVVSAVLGPQIVIFSKDLFQPILFAGAFVAVIPLCLLAIAVLAFLKLPALRDPEESGHTGGEARPLGEIVLTQKFLTGLICGISSYALMSFMMTGAPIAMVIGCGFSPDLATLGIQWHVLAMFGPSFFTGMLISKFGTSRVVAAGLLILMACATVAHLGIELWNFWSALVLLGIGWNFGFIGSTAIIASSYRPSEADKVQGFHDILLFSTVAIASFASGKVLTAYGWDTLNMVFWPVTLACLLLLVLLMRKEARAAGA